jgi:hypothetical protein
MATGRPVLMMNVVLPKPDNLNQATVRTEARPHRDGDLAPHARNEQGQSCHAAAAASQPWLHHSPCVGRQGAPSHPDHLAWQCVDNGRGHCAWLRRPRGRPSSASTAAWHRRATPAPTTPTEAAGPSGTTSCAQHVIFPIVAAGWVGQAQPAHLPGVELWQSHGQCVHSLRPAMAEPT